MHERIVPKLYPGRGINTHQTVPRQSVAGAMATIIVIRRRADREIDVAKLLVGAHGCPDIGSTVFRPRIVSPGLDARLAELRDGMEGPYQTAGNNIEAADIARGRR